ncbi:MAG: hypothetical protein D6714_01070 [Bacteroidetes bacterium]|nr:MAG: hypothetical protein D6714_01070 [Bacteroidota bacterium]
MKLNRLFLGVVFALLLLLTNCQDDRRIIKDYYFPVEDLKVPKVYEFESIGNEHDPPFYWLFQTVERGESTFLTGTFYSYDFVKYQAVEEEVVKNGMLLNRFRWFEKDTATQKPVEVPVQIEAGNVFGFELSDPPAVWVSSVHWRLPQDTLTKMTFIRNRQYEKDTTYTFEGKTYDCLKIYVRELIDNERDGHLEQEYEATELYAKGLGLVYFRKNIAKEWQMIYRLKHIYAVPEFEQKFNVRLQ